MLKLAPDLILAIVLSLCRNGKQTQSGTQNSDQIFIDHFVCPNWLTRLFLDNNLLCKMAQNNILSSGL